MQDLFSLSIGKPRLPSSDIHAHDANYLFSWIPKVRLAQSNIARSLRRVVDKTELVGAQRRKPNRVSNLAPIAQFPQPYIFKSINELPFDTIRLPVRTPVPSH